MNDQKCIIHHLNKKDDYGISVTNTETEFRLRKPHVDKDKFIFTKSDILEESASIPDWLDALEEKGFYPTAQIRLIRPNGSSMMTKEIVYFHFEEEDQPEDQNTPEQNTNASWIEWPINADKKFSSQDMVLIPIMEVLDLIAKEKSLEKFLELNQELREKTERLRDQKGKLRQKNIHLKMELKAEARLKEIALKKQAMEQKSVWDNPAIAKSIESLAGTLPTLLTKGKPPGGLAAGQSSLSEDKELFIEAMKDDRVTDTMILSLHQTLKRLVWDKEFAEKLHLFFRQHPVKNGHRHRRKKRNSHRHRNPTKKPE